MILNKRKLYPIATLALSFLYLITFALYYLSNYIKTETAFFIYADIFINKITYLLLPILIAVITLSYSALGSAKSALICQIPLTLSRFLYFLPYYYLIFFYGGENTRGALIFAFILSVVDSLFAYGLSTAVFLIMRAFIKKKADGEELKVLLARRTTLDFSDPVSLSFFLSALVSFLYFFIDEIINTVEFIKNYSFSFTGAEIIYTVFSYLFDFSLIFIYYYITAGLKNALIREKNDSPPSDEA